MNETKLGTNKLGKLLPEVDAVLLKGVQGHLFEPPPMSSGLLN